MTGHLDPEDLLISADVDEVMARAALHQLRWCQTREVTITHYTGTTSSDVCTSCVLTNQVPRLSI